VLGGRSTRTQPATVATNLSVTRVKARIRIGLIGLRLLVVVVVQPIAGLGLPADDRYVERWG
jgi:hypothetical protein